MLPKQKNILSVVLENCIEALLYLRKQFKAKLCHIKPYGDRIAVRVAEEENMSSGGIVIPDTADKERPQKG